MHSFEHHHNTSLILSSTVVTRQSNIDHSPEHRMIVDRQKVLVLGRAGTTHASHIEAWNTLIIVT